MTCTCLKTLTLCLVKDNSSWLKFTRSFLSLASRAGETSLRKLDFNVLLSSFCDSTVTFSQNVACYQAFGSPVALATEESIVVTKDYVITQDLGA